ncbi:MAG: hypothetical protein VW226_12905 [Rhodospirillaceae bacterium]
MKTHYALLMDANKNPLQFLPKTQRLQLMVLLSVMWSTIFCLAFGSWFWWGELVLGHIAVALGIVITSLTFGAARKKSHRDFYRSQDGTSRYDDLWGA